MPFLTDTRDTALPRGTPQPANLQCSFACCAWCLWIFGCISTPKQTLVLLVYPSPGFLTRNAAFPYSTTLFFSCGNSHPYCEEPQDHGIGVTSSQGERIMPLLSVKLLWDSMQDRGWHGEMGSLYVILVLAGKAPSCQFTFPRNFSAHRSAL